MMTVAQLAVEVTANTKPGEEGLHRVNQEVEKSGGLFSHFAGFAGNALSSLTSFVAGGIIMQGLNLAISAVTDTVRSMFDEAGNLSGAEDLLNQRLLSTHDAVGLSAQAIEDMAQRMSALSGITESTILQGDNMLLTFTGIGKDVFPQASQAMEDLAVSMNHGKTAGADFQTAAIELGKALNDPLKGMTALQRVGVTFTQQQKDLVAQYMATGDVADAQRVILQELAKEFGGTAVAAGSTFGGSLDKLKNIIVDFGANALQKLETWIQPVVEAFAKWLPSALDQAGQFFDKLGKLWNTTFLPELQEIIRIIQVDAAPGFQAIAGLVQKLIAPFEHLHVTLGPLQLLWNQLNTLVWQGTQAFNALATVLARGVGNSFTQTLKDWGPIVQSLAGWFQSSLVPALQSLLPVGERIANTFVTQVIPAFFSIRDAASHLIATMVSTLLPVFEKVEPIVVRLAGFLLDMGQKALAFLIPKVQDAVKAISQFATEMSTRLQPFIQNISIGIQVVAGIISAVWGILWPWVSSILKTAWDTITSVLKMAWDTVSGIFKIGADFLSGNWGQLWQDVKDTASNIWNDILGLFGGLFNNIINMIMNNPVAQFFGNYIIGPIKDAVQAAIGWIEGLWQAFLDWISGKGQGVAATTGTDRTGGRSGGRAAGGPVWAGGSFLVGEHGPEYFVPREHGTIVDTNKTQAMISAAAPHVRGGDTINLYGPTSDQLMQQLTLHQQRQKALVLAAVR